MISTVKCPSCHANLRVPADSSGGEYTCPRCLGVVALTREPVESAGIQAVPPVPPAPSTPPPLPGRTPTCPSCGKPVQNVWLFCPYCEEPLEERRSLRRDSSVDRDVRRDSTAAKTLLILLAVLGGLGVLWGLGMAVSEGPRGSPEAIVGILVLVLFAGLISTALMFWRTRRNPSERSIGRVVVGTFSIIGIVIAGGCALTAAAFVFAFVVCLAGGMRWH